MKLIMLTDGTDITTDDLMMAKALNLQPLITMARKHMSIPPIYQRCLDFFKRT